MPGARGGNSGKSDPLAKLALFWLALIVVQIILGAATIWSNKAADVATAHVLVGALSLVTGALVVYDCFPPFGGIARNCASYDNIRRVWGAPAMAANK